MATISYAVDEIKTYGEQAHVVSWAFTGGDTGVPIEMPGASTRSVQFAGTFNGATVVLEGSNDGTNYATLTDPQGNAISKTADALEKVEEVTRYVRPRVSAGAVTAVTITMLLRRER